MLDEAGVSASRVNHDMVLLGALEVEDEAVLRALLAEHVALTGSAHAADLLTRWAATRARFRKVEPRGAAAHVAAIRSAFLHDAARSGTVAAVDAVALGRHPSPAVGA